MKIFYFILIFFLLITIAIAYPKKMTDHEVSNKCCIGYISKRIEKTTCKSGQNPDLYTPCIISNIKQYSCFGFLGCNYTK